MRKVRVGETAREDHAKDGIAATSHGGIRWRQLATIHSIHRRNEIVYSIQQRHPVYDAQHFPTSQRRLILRLGLREALERGTGQPQIKTGRAPGAISEQ